MPSGHSLSFVSPVHAHGRRERPPPAPPPLRGGGELEAAAAPEASGYHCRTRRPRLPLVRHRPSAGLRPAPPTGSQPALMSSAGLRRSPRGAPRKAQANRQRVPPSVGHSRDRSAARASSGSVAAPASAPGVATPSDFRQPRRWHWRPRHPAPTGPPRSSGPGVSARSLPAPPAGCTRSLTGSRRCPRSMTPGTAAAPAPGCWPRLLRPAALGGALRKLRRHGCGSRKRPRVRTGTGSGPAPGPNSAHNMASVIRNCKQLTCRPGRHSYNSCYAHNRAGRVSGSKRPRATSSSGKAVHRPPAERPAAAARCSRCTGRAGGRGRRHIGPQLLHAAQQHGPGKAGRPPSRAPAPAHPAQRKQQQSRACRPGFPAAEV